MVGVSKLDAVSCCFSILDKTTYGVGDNVPSLIPLETLEINKDALQLDNGKRGVGIIELDGNLIGELAPGALRLLEAANNVVKRGGNPEVLLLEAQLLASLEVVVGVEDSTDGLSALLVGNGAFVVAIVELLEVELAARGLGGPQAQVVGRRGIVAGNRNVVGNSLDNLATLPGGHGLALIVGGLLDAAKELDLHRLALSRHRRT